MSRRRAVVFFGLFALFGGGLFWLTGLRPFLRVLDSRSWVETPAIVTASEVVRHPARRGETVDVTFRYDYTFAKRRYQASRHGFDSDLPTDRSLVGRFPVGSRVICWVNPKDPAESVIDRNAGWWLLLGFFPLAFLAVGLGGLLFVLAASRTARRPAGIRE